MYTCTFDINGLVLPQFESRFDHNVLEISDHKLKISNI